MGYTEKQHNSGYVCVCGANIFLCYYFTFARSNGWVWSAVGGQPGDEWIQRVLGTQYIYFHPGVRITVIFCDMIKIYILCDCDTQENNQ